MSEILKKMKKDSILALKEKNKQKKNFLSLVISDIETNGITNEERREITNDDALKVIRKHIKTIQSNMELVPKTHSSYNDYQIELDILNEYLPQQMSENDLTRIIDNVILELDDQSNKAFGKIMKYLNDNYKGEFDNKSASEIIKTKLSQ